ncbi:MAG: hypothetical protein ACI9U2_003288 [Bradymonadia bacterium]|jgi:hypothetical protein
MTAAWIIVALLVDGGLAPPSPAPVLVGEPRAPSSATPAAAPETAPPPKGPPPVANMVCAPNPLLVGQILKCTLTITHRNDVSVTVTAPPSFKTETPGPATPSGTGLQSVRVLSSQTLEPKPVNVRGLRIIWRESTGGEGRLAVPDQQISVRSVLAGASDPKFRTWAEPQSDAKAFFDRHGPVSWRVTNWALLIGLIAVGVILLGAGIGFVLRRWLDGRVREVGPPVDPRPAHIIALADLDALIAQPDLDVKTYYSRLSEIIRAYLERRYGFTALEMTSDEIRSQVRELALTGDARVAIDRFADETDMVKFAAYRPASGEQDTVMLAARGLIQITRQIAQVDPETAAAEAST